jgi:hypothetical protein
MSASSSALAQDRIDAAPVSTLVDGPRPWSPATRIAFRFGFAYWLLYYLPFPAGSIPGTGWIGKAYDRGLEKALPWIGKHILHISYTIRTGPNGSGDTTADWVFLFSVVVLASLTTIVWSILDRRRSRYDRLHELLRIYVRYTLAWILLGYGIIKVFRGQFPPPPPGRLLQSYGDSSPMGLMWTFMGASSAYVIFAGVSETLGALLLLARRTTTLGALVLTGVMTNVVMLNFCYDVPVKLGSTNYLVMSLFLLAPDARRLVDALVRNRATTPVALSLALPRRWMRWTRVVGKVVIIGLMLALHVKDAIENRSRHGIGTTKSYLDGLWDVEVMARNGAVVPPLLTDETRWRRIVFDRGYIRVRDMKGGRGPFWSFENDEKQQTLTLWPATDNGEADKSRRYVLRWTRQDQDHARLQGMLDKDVVDVELHRVDTSKMLLVTRGFHWISEDPYNR